MNKQREEFEAWFAKAMYHNHLKENFWDTWQKAQKVAVPEKNIVVNKGDYVELVKTNRERQKIIAQLTEEVKILRERKKHYKKLSKNPFVPEGYKLVPIEPTEAMIDAVDPFSHVDDIYKAVIEAVEDGK